MTLYVNNSTLKVILEPSVARVSGTRLRQILARLGPTSISNSNTGCFLTTQLHIRGILVRKPHLSRNPPWFQNLTNFWLPKILFLVVFFTTISNDVRKHRPPSAAGFFWAVWLKKIAISKGKMIQNTIFSGAPAAHQKNFGSQNRFWRNLASCPKIWVRNPPWFHLILRVWGGVPDWDTPDCDPVLYRLAKRNKCKI